MKCMRNRKNYTDNKPCTVSSAKTLTVCFLIYAVFIQMSVLHLPVKAATVSAALPPTVTPTAVVTTHRPTLNSGVIVGSLRLQTGESFNVSSGVTMSEIFLPGTPSFTFNSGSTNGGTVSDGGSNLPNNYRMTMNGGTITGKIHKQADPIAFPSDIPASVPNQSGTRSVNINSPGDVALIGNWQTLADLTVNVSNLTINVPPGNYRTITLNANSLLRFSTGTYNFSNTLTLNNNSRIETTGAAAINLRQSPNLNAGKFLLGANTLPSDVKLNILGSTLNVNSNCEINASVRIPNGTLAMNATNAAVRGMIWANYFTLSGGTVTGDTCASDGSGCNAVPSLDAVNPNRGLQGQTVQVNLTGKNTNWTSGQTRASFGGEIAVGGAPEGELGLITVTSATTAIANLSINQKAALAPRSVRVVTPLSGGQTEEVLLNDVFTVAPISPPGTAQTNVTTIAGSAGQSGFSDGAGTTARFRDLAGIAVGADDAVYIADAGNHRIRAARQMTNGGWNIQTIAGNGTAGFADGAGTNAKFNNPQSVAVAPDGSLYVADTSNNRIRKILPDGTVSTIAGDAAAGFSDGSGNAARFNSPKGIAVDTAGNIYVADTGNSAVRRIDANGNVVTIAGDGTIGSNDSPNARFNGLAGITVDGDNVYVYIADGTNHLIRRLDPSGSVMTIAGASRGFADGSAGEARFANPTGITVDGAGRIVVADTINSLIRAVSPTLAANGSPLAVSTLAGAGEYGSSDGAGNVARFKLPRGVAVARSSAIFVADTGSNTLRRIGIPPQILSFSPASARIADTITIYGENFDGRGSDKNTVTFAKTGGGTVTGTVSYATRTQLSVVVPAQAATGRITVTTADGTAQSASDFQVETTPPPAITDFTPRRGQTGTSVKLTGTSLKPAAANPVVTFAGTNNTRLNALVNSATNTEVNVLVPNGAITGFIQLMTAVGTAQTPQEFVVDETQEFQITVSPATVQAVARTQGTAVVHLNSSNSTFTQLARLSAVNLPAGVTATFEPENITAGASSTLKLNLSNAAVSSGSFPFLVRAKAIIDGHEITKEATATLSVLTAGQTTLSGRVLNTDSEPVIGATVSLDGKTTTTDSSGTFTLSGVTAGEARPLQIDGRTASAPNRTYPVITEPANIIAGQANQIPYIFYLPPIDTQYEVTVVPGQTTNVSNPRVEGLQMTIPPNANLRNRDGSPVTRVSITPLAIDRTPTPLPPNVKTGLVYTSQPGGALTDVPIPVVYPNLLGVNPGVQVELYAFNHDTVQWYIYGYGRVSEDGKTIAPEINPNTGQPYGLLDFSWHFPNAGPDGNPNGGDSCPTPVTPKPVDLSSGIKLETATDISFGGSRGGITITRNYSSDNSAQAIIGRFGRGWKDNYEIKLDGSWTTGGAGRIVRPNEQTGRLFSYNRTDADGSLVFTSSATVSQLADTIKKLTNGTLEYRYSGGEKMIFDSSGKMTAVLDRNGNTTTLSYSGERLTQITDPVGRVVSYQYDGSGRVIRITDPLDRSWTYSYNTFFAYGILETVTDPLGNVTRYDYSVSDGIRLSSITDPRGNVVKQISYEDGRVISQKFADGGIETYEYQLTGGIVTQTIMTDPLGRKMSKRFNANGYVIEQRDALGQVSKIDRNLNNNLSNSTVGSCGCAEESRRFDERGNKTEITDQQGNTTRYEYEPTFNKVTKVTDKLNRQTLFGYDANGNLTSITDAIGRTASMSYDQYGRVANSTDALNQTEIYEYDANGFMNARVDKLGKRWTMNYDSVGRLLSQIDPLGRTVSYSYDNLDRLIAVEDTNNAVTRFGYDNNGNRTSVKDALNHIWRITYDAKNRGVKRTDPLGRSRKAEYDLTDLITKAVSPSGRSVSYEYDSRGQVVKMFDGLNNTIELTYDYEKKLKSLKNERGNLTTFEYDELDRPVSQRNPLGQTSSAKYDALGNMIEATDELGRKTIVSYDAVNRVQTVNYADAQVGYTYDNLNRPTQVTDTQGGTLGWTYNALGQVLNETAVNSVVSYSYNDARQRTSMTVQGRPSVNYSYDAAGRLSTISQGAENFGYTYDTLSRLESLTRPNNVTTSYEYDQVSRLKRLKHFSNSQTIEDLQYGYNADDEIASISSLNSATLLPSPKTAQTADEANRVNQFGGTNYSFDAKGQTSSRTDSGGTTVFNWDARGRMTSANLPNGQTVSYGYDALGRRRSRSANNQTTQFVYDRRDVVQDKQSANIQADYVNGLGIDNKLKISNSSGSLYYLKDHLGSTQGLTGVSGNVAEWQRYEAFGNSNVSNSLTRYGYTGRERDEQTGLNYYRARWYDAQQGRFITQDPIGFQGGDTNIYRYVKNNVINSVDPSGLDGPPGTVPTIPDDGEPLRKTPKFITDPPRPSPTPSATPNSTPSPTPTAPGKKTDCTCTNTPYQNSFPGTFQLGLNFNFTYGIANINASYGIAVDTSGNIATYKEGGGGAALGAGASGVVNFNFSNGRNIRDLNGWFTNGSVGLGDGADAQVNGFVSPDGSVKGGGFGLGVGAGGGASLTETWTEVGDQYNIFSGRVCP